MAAAAVSLVVWLALPSDLLSSKTYHPGSSNKRLLRLSEGVAETIWITEDPESGARTLYTNGHSMSGSLYSSQRYMRAFVHLPMLQLERAERVLVLCFGIGNTAHAASLYSEVEAIHVVDLSRHIVEHGDFFARWNHDVLSDPRVEVYINDGRQHLRMQPPKSYDLVTLEPPPITHAGVSSLYSREFYRLVRERLRPGGFLSQWLPAQQVPGRITSAIVGAFVEVFPGAILVQGYGSEFILVGRKGGPPRIDPGLVMRRLEGQPAVWADLQRIDLGSLLEIIGTFAGSHASLAATAAAAHPITDDWPSMEYSHITFTETVIPESLFDITRVGEWCPGCFDRSGPIPELRLLGTYLACLNAYYQSTDLRVTSSYRRSHRSGAEVRASPAAYAATWHASRYLQRFFPAPEEAASGWRRDSR
jgi:spermidine synthase